MLAGSSRQRRKCLKIMPNAVIYGKEEIIYSARIARPLYGASYTLFDRKTQDVQLRRGRRCIIFEHIAKEVGGSINGAP
jgi:hypothetical protein